MINFFTDSKTILPCDDITDCVLPHMQFCTCKNEDNIHAISVSSVKLCISISFKELPMTYFIIEQPNIYEND